MKKNKNVEIPMVVRSNLTVHFFCTTVFLNQRLRYTFFVAGSGLIIETIY